MGERTQPRCAVFAADRIGWFVEMVLAAPGLDLYAPPADLAAPITSANPLGLRTTKRWEIALLTSEWLSRLLAEGGVEFSRVMLLIRRMSQAVVGLEGNDGFSLAIPPICLAALDRLVKAQGVYRDLDEYNRSPGVLRPSHGRTPRDQGRYTDRDLEHIALSLPCFAAIDPAIRDAIRTASGTRGFRRYSASLVDRALGSVSRVARSRVVGSKRVHCVGSLTNLRRLDALEQLTRSDLLSKVGITRIPDDFFGTGRMGAVSTDGTWRFEESANRESGLRNMSWDERTNRDGAAPLVLVDGRSARVEPELAAEVRQRVSRLGIRREETHRTRYTLGLARSHVVVAPPGYGELTFRHGEALRAGRVLVTANPGNVETLLQLTDGVNAVFCSSDFSDVVERCRWALNSAPAPGIAQRGHQDWVAWTRNPTDLLRRGITRPITSAIE